MKTVLAKTNEIPAQWHIVDAQGKVLGRLASAVAQLLIGKGKVLYSPHQLCGDFVVIINADKVRVTGRKLEQKVYYRHSGYPGGIRSRTAGELMATKPADVVRFAIKGMLPKNRLGMAMLRRVKIYAGSDHPHEAQIPKPLEL